MSPITPKAFWKGWDAAFLYWALKGFKGKFDDEIQPNKRTRNIITSFITWGIILIFLSKFLN